MIYRHYYTAQLLDGVSFADIEKQLGGSYTAPEAVVSITVSAWRKRLFLYFETRDVEELSPDVLWGGLESFLELWPGAEEKRLWVPMFDIFHYNAPVVDEEWMRHSWLPTFSTIISFRRRIPAAVRSTPLLQCTKICSSTTWRIPRMKIALWLRAV